MSHRAQAIGRKSQGASHRARAGFAVRVANCVVRAAGCRLCHRVQTASYGIRYIQTAVHKLQDESRAAGHKSAERVSGTSYVHESQGTSRTALYFRPG